MGILDDFLGLVRRHPETSFIGAHFGAYAENLAWVGTMLDLCPNYSIDISERIGELGRQPYSTRSFFLKYADRILFGLDLGPNLGEYRLYYRFLETADEYFNYNASPMPRQGRWRICGLNLPDDVLKKIYYNNAARLFGIPELPSDAEAAASSR
jgi:predicted TIM-barrel fold metal-dependent hydrolase